MASATLTACDFFLGTHFDDAHLAGLESPGNIDAARGDDADDASASADGMTSQDSSDRSDASDGSSPDLPVAIAAAGFHTCALTKAGALSCWGSLRSGEDIDVLWQSGAPQRISLPRPVRSFSTGEGHSCAVTDDGSVHCWGRNRYGQLGDGSLTVSIAPVPVLGLGERARSVSVGLRHSCALLESSGSVKCWGAYPYVGSPGTVNATRPVTVTGIASAAGLSAGSFHTCARSGAARIQCWGSNEAGQLGNGSLTESREPVDPHALPGVPTKVTAADMSTYAITDEGALIGWGRGFPVEAGIAPELSPVAMTNVPPFVDFAAGRDHACIVTKASAVACWGTDRAGELGLPRPTAPPFEPQVTIPVRIDGIPGLAAAVAAGPLHSCALTRDGRVFCWGANNSGQLGVGDAGSPSPTPLEVHW